MFPVHPGSILREELEVRGTSANALSRALRVPPGRIIDILNGKRAISADTALRLGRYFGNDAEFWMQLQAQYDLVIARQNVGKRVEIEVQPRDNGAEWSPGRG
ncbi:HigA family addiction module antidote protein [Vineibacter terrae]|uniref:HigA family addiction module antidote protein n=1 Tax=Vineibacter terrae TaxID=2586908 RepID=A0A5C8PAG3_9HYPH|nr:HigA family addiction module antitoxin [Vineibacter terrae]TXL70746.1 HigA family addiction module antidote protein [Vineibacter terrae]